MTVSVPHVRIVLAVCVAAILGYAAFSIWVVFYSNDAAQRGDVIGTWKSFAVAAFTFWLGSSSGGKAKDGEPVKTEVTNPPNRPIPTTDLPSPEFGNQPKP